MIWRGTTPHKNPKRICHPLHNWVWIYWILLYTWQGLHWIPSEGFCRQGSRRPRSDRRGTRNSTRPSTDRCRLCNRFFSQMECSSCCCSVDHPLARYPSITWSKLLMVNNGVGIVVANALSDYLVRISQLSLLKCVGEMNSNLVVQSDCALISCFIRWGYSIWWLVSLRNTSDDCYAIGF